jgi:hypothetical protein
MELMIDQKRHCRIVGVVASLASTVHEKMKRRGRSKEGMAQWRSK